MTDDERSARLLRELFMAGFMAGLPASNVAWAAARLASAMDDRRLRAGEVLYRTGELSTEHFFIVEGEMKLETEGAPAWTFGARALIGTIDLMLDRPRSRTATATRATHLLRMSARDWLDMLEDNFELTRSAVQGLADGIEELRVAMGDLREGGPAAPREIITEAHAHGLGLVDHILALRRVPLFAGADVQALTNLALLSRAVSFRPGDEVVASGEPSEAMYVVLSGALSSSRSSRARVETARAGELLFGSAAVSAAHREHHARAEVASRVLRVALEDYFDVMEEHFALARSAFKALSAEREMLINERGRRAARM